ncbi:hypothetical protein [Permianibacter aggregans]|uniref:Uncharacterized protein n=1 Tax=Permianibacter aggregans TaxID=1510150 RepID=A0A4R6URR5_9GAMM|nr:hypothetical protein [Permianibacter aggregans]QGX40878.1 hypothetical protein E2H98_14885 [Permianibacter aggregans]TDQ48303.1 hypothetical protein EV696_10739 [Permianibacter aggregans]
MRAKVHIVCLLMKFGVLDIALHYLVIAIGGGGPFFGFVALMLNNWLIEGGVNRLPFTPYKFLMRCS